MLVQYVPSVPPLPTPNPNRAASRPSPLLPRFAAAGEDTGEARVVPAEGGGGASSPFSRRSRGSRWRAAVFRRGLAPAAREAASLTAAGLPLNGAWWWPRGGVRVGRIWASVCVLVVAALAVALGYEAWSGTGLAPVVLARTHAGSALLHLVSHRWPMVVVIFFVKDGRPEAW